MTFPAEPAVLPVAELDGRWWDSATGRHVRRLAVEDPDRLRALAVQVAQDGEASLEARERLLERIAEARL